MYYDRQLRYLELWKDGEKICTAGFVKAEVTGELCSMQIQVTGLPVSENGQYQVYLEGWESDPGINGRERSGNNESVLDVIGLHDGKGSLVKRRIPVSQLCGDMSYAQLHTIRIPMGEKSELICHWRTQDSREEKLSSEEPAKQVEHTDSISEKESDLSAVAQKSETAWQVKEVVVREAATQEQEPVAREEETARREREPSEREPEVVVREYEPSGREPEVVVREYEPSEREAEPVMRNEAGKTRPEPVNKPMLPVGMKEQKWQQLSEIYPHISPFRDERDYLSLTPADFVVLPQKDYRLVANSFLLHGYYNYGHLVLARKMRRGQEVYYLGVPGNFFDREREVAIMFGFESFECKTEPASDGDYGYYMMRVDL